jgi:hypothetical protein
MVDGDSFGLTIGLFAALVERHAGDVNPPCGGGVITPVAARNVFLCGLFGRFCGDFDIGVSVSVHIHFIFSPPVEFVHQSRPE